MPALSFWVERCKHIWLLRWQPVEGVRITGVLWDDGELSTAAWINGEHYPIQHPQVTTAPVG